MVPINRVEMSEGIVRNVTDDVLPILRVLLALWVFWPAADVKKYVLFFNCIRCLLRL